MDKHWKYEIEVSPTARKITPVEEEKTIESIFGMSLKNIAAKVRELGYEDSLKYFEKN